MGAPWEESGAIYIYNGGESLKDNVKPTASQRITIQSSAYSFPTLGIQTFGFSIAEPIDVDANGSIFTNNHIELHRITQKSISLPGENRAARII